MHAIVVRSDGRIIIGGDFTRFNGVDRMRIAQLQPDGSLDSEFIASIDNTAFETTIVVRVLLLDSQDRVIAGGRFATANGVSRRGLARFLIDGSLDEDFRAGFLRDGDSVSSLSQTAGGRLFVAGTFAGIGGTRSIARLNESGAEDVFFSAPDTLGLSVTTVIGLNDGGALVGGTFSEIGGVERQRLALLSPSGQVDLGFDAGTAGRANIYDLIPTSDGGFLVASGSLSGGTTILEHLDSSGASDPDFAVEPSWRRGIIQTLVQQPDGHWMIGGDFSRVNGIPRRGVARITASGAVDQKFDSGEGPSSAVGAIAIQSDGRIVVGGRFSTFAGQPQRYLARLEQNGALDMNYRPVIAGGIVSTLHVLPDDRLLVGGDFAGIAMSSRPYLARLTADGAIDPGFMPGSPDGGVRDISPMPDSSLLTPRDI